MPVPQDAEICGMVKDLWQLNREVAKVFEGEVRIANDLLWHMDVPMCHLSSKKMSA